MSLIEREKLRKISISADMHSRALLNFAKRLSIFQKNSVLDLAEVKKMALKLKTGLNKHKALTTGSAGFGIKRV